MKRFLLATVFGAVAIGSAQAADMPAYKAAPPPADYFSWTGFYIGVHGGYAWKESRSTIVTQNGTPPSSFPIGFTLDTNKPSGFVGGGQIGVNYQTGMWVLGLEADASAAGVRGSTTTVSPVNAAVLSTTELREDWLATATGRLGLAFGHTLYYVKGGAAWTHLDSDSRTSVVTGGAAGLRSASTGSDNRVGWLVGFGTEIAGTGTYSNWSLKIESAYIDYGTERVDRNQTFAFSPAQGAVGEVSQRDNKLQETVFKVGLNYRLGGYGGGYGAAQGY